MEDTTYSTSTGCMGNLDAYLCGTTSVANQWTTQWFSFHKQARYKFIATASIKIRLSWAGLEPITLIRDESHRVQLACRTRTTSNGMLLDVRPNDIAALIPGYCNCYFVVVRSDVRFSTRCHWKLLARELSRKRIFECRRQALETPAYKQQTHVTSFWCMIFETVLRRPQGPTRTHKAQRVREVARIRDARTTSGAFELARKSFNVSRTRVTTLNVCMLTNRSCELL